jgi:hypothetical protein
MYYIDHCNGSSFSLHGLENLSYRTTFVHSNILFRFLKNVSLVLIAHLFMTRISVAHIAWIFGLPGWYIKVQAYLLPSLILGIENSVEAELLGGGGGGNLNKPAHRPFYPGVSNCYSCIQRPHINLEPLPCGYVQSSVGNPLSRGPSSHTVTTPSHQAGMPQ